jgi:arsenical pump membrane protein
MIGFAGRTWLAALAAVTVTVLVLALSYRRDLVGRYPIPTRELPEDRVLFRASAAVCLLVGPLFVAGANVALVACAGAAVLAALFAVRRLDVLQVSLLPWRERCAARDVRISAREFAAVGLIGVPLLLVCSVLGLIAAR